jgi:hypothetical protein
MPKLGGQSASNGSNGVTNAEFNLRSLRLHCSLAGVGALAFHVAEHGKRFDELDVWAPARAKADMNIMLLALSFNPSTV